MSNKYMESCSASLVIREILPQRDSSLSTLEWVKFKLIFPSNSYLLAILNTPSLENSCGLRCTRNILYVCEQTKHTVVFPF